MSLIDRKRTIDTVGYLNTRNNTNCIYWVREKKVVVFFKLNFNNKIYIFVHRFYHFSHIYGILFHYPLLSLRQLNDSIPPRTWHRSW